MFEELKNRLAIWVNILANEEGDNVVEAIAAIETLEAKLATANARIDELESAFHLIANWSNGPMLPNRNQEIARFSLNKAKGGE